MASLSIDVTRQVTMADVETTMIDLLACEDGVMAQAARHHLGSGGGRARARLALQSANALKLSFDTSRAISAACELLHNASLVHDDLQDGDTVRRGEFAVWKKFGSNRDLPRRFNGLCRICSDCIRTIRPIIRDNCPYASACQRRYRWTMCRSGKRLYDNRGI